jgi:hypothetical protein
MNLKPLRSPVRKNRVGCGLIPCSEKRLAMPRPGSIIVGRTKACMLGKSEALIEINRCSIVAIEDLPAKKSR